jgi:hypothetical protein
MSNELKEVEDKEIAVLGNQSGIEGLEEIEASDIVIPRAKLVQGSSNLIKNPDDYPHIRVGMLVNSVDFSQLEVADDNDKAYPFIPVKMFKSWVKFKEDKSLEEKTYDSKSALATGPDAWMYKQLNFLGFQPNTQTPIIFTFSKTSYKSGQDIINIAQIRQKPLYNNLFSVGTKNESKDGNDYSVMTVHAKGEPDAELVTVGQQMYQQFNPILSLMKTNSGVKIHDEQQEVKEETPPWEE